MIVSLPFPNDIEKPEYTDLIEWCFQCSSCFSLLDPRWGKDPAELHSALEELSQYMILKRETQYFPGYDECFEEGRGQSVGKVPTLYLFRCCEETKQFILKHSKSIYSWRYFSLDDLCFYRKNESRVFHSVAHEAICWISCTPEEYAVLPNKELWEVQSETEIDDEWYF